MDHIFSGIPRDRISLNTMIRNHYALSPILNGVIQFHSSYPISEFMIEASPDKYDCCMSILKALDLAECKNDSFKPGANLLQLSKEYWLLGEVFPLIKFDNVGCNSGITLLNPDAIFIKNDMFTKSRRITLRPEPTLLKLIKSNNPADVAIKNKMSPEFIDSVKEGNVLLDNEEVSHIIRLISPYDLRGTSIILPVLKELILFEKLRETSDPTDWCVDSIYRGLMFSKSSIHNANMAYVDYRRRISRWLLHSVLFPIMKQNFSIESEEISIKWKDIDLDELKSHLWSEKSV